MSLIHRHEDDPSFEVAQFHTLIQLSPSFENLLENSQCSDSWEIFPLELPFVPRRSDPKSLRYAYFQKTSNLGFPCFDWFSTDTTQTQH